MKIWTVYGRIGTSSLMVLDFWSTKEKADKSKDKWYRRYTGLYRETVTTWINGPYTIDKHGAL